MADTLKKWSKLTFYYTRLFTLFLLNIQAMYKATNFIFAIDVALDFNLWVQAHTNYVLTVYQVL